MKSRNLILLTFFIISLSLGCRNKSQPADENQATIDSIITALKHKKRGIDNYLLSHQKSLILFAKLYGKDTLVPVKNDQWPDSTECSYDILKDNSGKIILIGEVPFSESGDWNIERRYYFDEIGKTLAFTSVQSRLTDQVPGGVAREKNQTYYDTSFTEILGEEQLIDGKDRSLTNKKIIYDFMGDELDRYKNVNDCLEAYHIDKSKL